MALKAVWVHLACWGIGKASAFEPENMDLEATVGVTGPALQQVSLYQVLNVILVLTPDSKIQLPDNNRSKHQIHVHGNPTQALKWLQSNDHIQ